MKTKVLLADDHKIVRDGLCSLINQQSNMEVIAAASNGRDAVKLAMKIKPDVVIMDITMPDLNGFEATRQIISELPGTKVIALSMHSDRKYVTGMLEAGASGYLLKDCAFQELAKAINSVGANHTYLSPAIAGVVIKAHPNGLKRSSLSPREREIVQLLAEGKTARQISETLHIGVKTVETHRHNSMEKLNIHSTAELVKYAIREGLCTLDKL